MLPSLVRPNNPADITRGGLRRSRFSVVFFGGFGDHVDVLEAGAGVEKHGHVVFAEKVARAESLIGSQGRRALRRGKDAFYLRPVTDGGEDITVADGDRRSFGLLQYVENDVVAVGLGDAQSGSQGFGIGPGFGSGLMLIERFNNRRATA